jgi:CTP-dependent riboflavin kinase
MYKANPGMQILGRGYIDGDIAPGFDPREYVEVKYKKISVYSSTIEKHKEVIGNRLLTKQEISTSLPPKIVVSKVDQAKAMPSIDELSTATQDMDAETGNVTLTQAEADALSAEWLAERTVFYDLISDRNNTNRDRSEARLVVRNTKAGSIERAEAVAKVEKLNADLEKIRADAKASRKRTNVIVNRAESAGYIAGGDWKNGEPVFVTEEEYKKRYK